MGKRKTDIKRSVELEGEELCQALADIIIPFHVGNAEEILKKASLVGNTKNGGAEVHRIVVAAHRAYKRTLESKD